MTDAFDKAFEKLAEALELVPHFEIELSEQEVFDDLTYGRDGRAVTWATPQAKSHLS